uniref:Uncharacterized protein n=1 Tax=Gouania willdenowi TaxID=441366 RepID=A0A8C5EI69_GOUWI
FSEISPLIEQGMSASEPQTMKQLEELHLPEVPMEVEVHGNTCPPALNLHNMDWLDLTLCVPAEGVNTLDVAMPVGVFPSDFLDSHELHLNWD